MKRQRINLTRYKWSRSMCRNMRQVKKWKRKVLKKWINPEFD